MPTLPVVFHTRSFLLIIGGFFGAAFFSGCAHYRLGQGEDALTFETLYVAPITNEAAVPQAVAVVSRQLRTALIRDGRITLASDPSAADAVLNVKLVDYGRTFTAACPTTLHSPENSISNSRRSTH